MNGRIEGPLPEIVTTDWFVTETLTLEQVTVSANSDYEADVSIAKKPGYRLIGIVGFDLGRVSGTRYHYFQLYRLEFTVGDGDTDTITIGLRSNYSSSGKPEMIYKLLYIREDWT